MLAQAGLVKDAKVAAAVAPFADHEDVVFEGASFVVVMPAPCRPFWRRHQTKTAASRGGRLSDGELGSLGCASARARPPPQQLDCHTTSTLIRECGRRSGAEGDRGSSFHRPRSLRASVAPVNGAHEPLDSG